MEERILFIKLDPKTEADIICWINSLPPRTANKTVNEIVIAESRGQIARIPYEFSYTNEMEPLRCRLFFRSKAALNFLAKIPKGEYKSTLVKIIRRHIEKNKGLPPAPYDIHHRYLFMITNNFIKLIKDTKLETKGVPNRHDKLNEFYEVAVTNFSNAVLNCYEAMDKKHGDYNLYHLDCKDIVNKAFVQVFGEIAKPVNESANQNSVAAPASDVLNSADENKHTPKPSVAPITKKLVNENTEKTKAEVKQPELDFRDRMMKMTER